MGITPECIAAVITASGNTMDDRDATELLRYTAALRKAEEGRGNLDNLEARVRAAAAKGAERAEIGRAIQRKHAALSAIRFAESVKQLDALRAEGQTYKQAFMTMLEGTFRNVEGGRASIAADGAAFVARYMQDWNRLMATNRALQKRVHDRSLAVNTLREMREPGSTPDPEAKALAEVYVRASEMARTDLNRHGATIGRLDGWTPQAHDAQKIVLVSRDEWRAFIEPRLDLERSFPGADADTVRMRLDEAYQHIVTGVDTKAPSETGRVGPANLANSLSAARVLHFRDASGWLQYNERFGGGDIHNAMLGHLKQAAKLAAQMSRLGPNPEATLTRLVDEMRLRASRDPKLSPAEQQSATRALTLDAGGISSAWAEVSGLTSAPHNLTLAKIASEVRAAMSLAKLGGAVVSSFSDVATRTAQLSYQGKPLLGEIGRALLDLLPTGRSSAEREIAAVLGAGVDGVHGAIMHADVATDPSMGWFGRRLPFFFQIQGMTGWTDAQKAGSARALARWAGVQSDRPFENLAPQYRKVLRQHGIGAGEWELIRKTAYAVEGDTYVTPDRIAALPAARFQDLAKPAIEAINAGLGERLAQRQAADAREAEWVAGRTAKLEESMRRAVETLQKRNRGTDTAAERQADRLRERLSVLQGRLSDLAEFSQAVQEGRVWTPSLSDEELAHPDIFAWKEGDPLPADVAAAEARSAELAHKPTNLDQSPERLALRDRVVSEVLARRASEIPDGPAMERQAVVVLGPPAAGKSTIVNPLSQKMRALIIDADDMKEALPEFDGGLGAARVHRESSQMAMAARQTAMQQGVNLAIPTVGSAATRDLVEGLQAAGYRVTVILNDLPAEKAMKRNWLRFRQTGRLVPRDIVEGGAKTGRQAYLDVKEIADAHAEYTNDVPKGVPPAHRGGDSDPLGGTDSGGGGGGERGGLQRRGRGDGANIQSAGGGEVTGGGGGVNASNDVPRGADPLHVGGSSETLVGADVGGAGGGGRSSPVGLGRGSGGNPPPTESSGGSAKGEGGGVGGRSSNTSLSGTALTGGTGRSFSPKSERYLDQGNPLTLAARAEGELRARTDALRRAMGEVSRASTQTAKSRLQGLVTWWNRRDNELHAFIRQVDERRQARAEATLAETADWQPRVDRALADARTDLELKLRRFYADEMKGAMIEPDEATRRAMFRGTRAGTGVGELLRFMFQFKSFPIAFSQRVLGRSFYGFSPDERRLQAFHIGQLIASTTMLGYLSMSAKDLLRGYTPRDLSRPEVWLAALTQGGGMGIYGDYLFAKASRFGNSPLESAAGPGLSAAANLVSLWQAAKGGDVTQAQAFNVALQNTPFVNLWYARPALDYLILNAFREYLSPGFMARMHRDRHRDYGQEQWAPASAW